MRVHRDAGGPGDLSQASQALPSDILSLLSNTAFHNHSTTEVQVDGEWRACFGSRKIRWRQHTDKYLGVLFNAKLSMGAGL
jgi:hypothetical protein